MGYDPEHVRQLANSREKVCNGQPSSYPPPLPSRALSMTDRYSTTLEAHNSGWHWELCIFQTSSKQIRQFAHSLAILSLSQSASKAPTEALNVLVAKETVHFFFCHDVSIFHLSLHKIFISLKVITCSDPSLKKSIPGS
jgi:hypothetical protein